jgi:hypothetical protein
VPSTLGIVASGFSGFSPLDLSPALWLDAADTSTITASGGSVSQWNDKSGNGRNVTQATGLNQPTTGSATQNGLNVLSFDGSNDSLVSAAFTVPNSGFSAYAVVSATSSTTRFIFEQSTTTPGQAGQRFMWRRGGPASLVFGYYDGSAFRDYIKPWTYSSGTYFIVSGATDGANVVQTLSGTADTTSARTGYPQTASRALAIGRPVTEGGFWQGTIAEFLLFDADHDAPTRALVHGYLSTKWGITL